MKKIKIIILLVCCSVFMFCGCSFQKDNVSYLRIHIRANSNSPEDQEIKYMVKDVVVTYLTPIIQDAKSIDEVKEILTDNTFSLCNLVDEFLKTYNFDYKCNIHINNEFFPTREYGDLVLKADYYDALIINLGTGTGNNWWCVVYPPLCFTGNNIVYKSKIVELIKKLVK